MKAHSLVLSDIMAARKLIPGDTYSKFREAMPIACADAIVWDRDRAAVLLGKRADPPVQDVWWFIGGRIHRGETVAEAVAANVLSETGLKVKLVNNGIVGIGTTIFKIGEDRHTPNVTCLVEVVGGELQQTKHFSEIRWIETLNDVPLLEYVRDQIDVSGVLRGSPAMGIREYVLDERELSPTYITEIARN